MLLDSETGGPFPFFAVMQKEIYNILLLKQYFYIFLSKSRIYFSLFIFKLIFNIFKHVCRSKNKFWNVFVRKKVIIFCCAVGKNGWETDCSQGCLSSHGKSHREKSGKLKLKSKFKLDDKLKSNRENFGKLTLKLE